MSAFSSGWIHWKKALPKAGQRVLVIGDQGKDPSLIAKYDGTNFRDEKDGLILGGVEYWCELPELPSTETASFASLAPPVVQQAARRGFHGMASSDSDNDAE